MGQIERYGLYVLVIVIFLILGVAIWGGNPQVPTGPSLPADLLGNGTRASSRVANRPATERTTTRRPSTTDFDDLFSLPEERTADVGDLPGFDDLGAGSDPVTPPNGPRGGTVDEPVAPPRAPLSRTYRIAEGDTLGKIAKRELGGISKVSAIEELNPGVDPRRLQIGQEIKLPVADGGGGSKAVEASASRGTVPAVHVVVSGDTFEGIAKRYFGSAFANKVLEIEKLNPRVDARKIRPGMKIKLPDAGVVASR